MARTFRRRPPPHAISDLNVTNLVDLAFTLLIVFMIAAPLIKPEQTIQVDLPKESAAPQPKQDPLQRFESITVMPDGGVLLANRPLSLRALATELAKFAQEPKPPFIRLRIDAKATAQQFVSVMEELKKQNLLKFQLDTQVAR